MAVNAEIDALTSRLGAEAAARHFTRWPQLGQFTVISPPGWQTRTTYQSEVDYLKDWLRDRSAWIDAQFPQRPAAAPPPGTLAGGGTVTLTTAAGQTIYYMIDGSDPRQPGGAVATGASSVASGESFAVNESALITARARNGSVWGPPFRGAYLTGTPASAATLVISEFLYHPADPVPEEIAALPGVTADEFEFIELRNIGVGPVDLTGATFTDGIGFIFPPGSTLAPGAFLAVVKNEVAFALRYGAGPPLAGPYEGNLSNSGETVVLAAADGSEIARLTYSDAWSPAADGLGYSLVLKNPGAAPASYDAPSAWAWAARGTALPARTTLPRRVWVLNCGGMRFSPRTISPARNSVARWPTPITTAPPPCSNSRREPIRSIPPPSPDSMSNSRATPCPSLSPEREPQRAHWASHSRPKPPPIASPGLRAPPPSNPSPQRRPLKPSVFCWTVRARRRISSAFV